MGFRFWRRIKILPGVTLNLSGKGASVSLGPRGAKVTVGKSGVRGTVGLPGTGLFYTKKLTTKGKKAAAPKAAPSPAPPSPAKSPLPTPVAVAESDRAFVAAMHALAAGNEDGAWTQLAALEAQPDAAFVGGVLALKRGDAARAVTLLERAVAAPALDERFARYGLTFDAEIPITDEVAAAVGPDRPGALLAAVEAYQRLGRLDDGLAALTRLRELAPGDVAVKLSLAELWWEKGAPKRTVADEVVRLAEGVGNESPLHAALLLYKGRALRALGMAGPARETLAAALAKKKGRPPDLLAALRYELAGAYEDAGDKKRARLELERLYAADPDYEDVKTRLGLG